jgi:O-antigen ligase/tetratricopeptide (TPR) repeat protein
MADTPRRGSAFARPDAEAFAHKAITLWLPVLYFLISSVFFLRTYDSAQVKISMMQMGGLGLLTLWLCRLALAGRAAFNRQDLVTLAPFLAYLAVGICSFLHAPYRMASVDFFLRQTFYMIVALIAIYEFDQPSVDRLFRWLILAAWVAVGYGTLQFIDTNLGLFKPGVGQGIDPFVWRGAFGPRVFSTYGNPNFYGDFLVIIFPVLLSQFLKTRRWSLVPLMAMLLINLFATGTKGAWLGFAIVCVLFGILALTYFKELARAYRVYVLGIAAAGFLGLVGYTAHDLETRIVSINFRLFTWEATWEMIRTQPWIGSGVGAFPPLYPAFRRPPIFHIEGKHNTETDHAEDEYLEEFLDHGIIGFGIFLWLVFSTLFIGFRSLGQLTNSLSLKDGRPPPRAWDLAGLLVSLCGMLAHNFFDVSLRFVSSGVYLGLLSGMIVNVARGRGLFELHARDPRQDDGEGSAWRTVSDLLIWPMRLAAAAGIFYFAFLHDHKAAPMSAFGGMYGQFSSLMGPLDRAMAAPGGELLQWWLSWGVFAGCTLGLGYAMVRLCFMSETPVVPALVLAMLQPLSLLWGFFRADVHHNIAIYFSKDHEWAPAISNYLMVNKLNPDFVMSKYFLGNVFNDRFNMTKVAMSDWGDPAAPCPVTPDSPSGTCVQPMDDYERALYWYNEVRRLSPNYVQMHHQVGNLHMRRAQWAIDNHHPQEEVDHYLDLAMNRFRLYEEVDPVYAPNYYRIAQIYMMRRQFPEAIRTYREYIAAQACAVDPGLLNNDFLRRTILSYQPYLQETNADGRSVWVHRHASLQEPHEAAEAYTNLANVEFTYHQADPGVPGVLEAAELDYRRALGFEGNFDQAVKNLQVVYRLAQQEGRVRPTAKPAQNPGPGEPIYTGYEVGPKKG